MSSKEGKVVVDLTAGIVGRWKETYQWIPIFGAFATVAMAFSAGANNLTAPVGLSPFLFFFVLFFFSNTCVVNKYSVYIENTLGSMYNLFQAQDTNCMSLCYLL